LQAGFLDLVLRRCGKTRAVDVSPEVKTLWFKGCGKCRRDDKRRLKYRDRQVRSMRVMARHRWI